MNIFNLSRSFLKRLRSKATVDPVRDWLAMLTLSVIALISIIIWNIWAFETVVGGGTIGVPATGPSTVFNNSSLDTIRNIFENRASEEKKYRTGVYQFSDPSQ